MIDSKYILKYLAGTLSETDSNRVKLWIDASEENKSEYLLYKTISEKSNQLDDIKIFNAEQEWNELENLLKNSSSKVVNFRQRMIRVISIAAVFLLLIFSAYFYFSQEPLYKEVVTSDFTDTLKLVDGSIVYLENNSKIKYFNRIEKKSKRRYVELNGKAKFEVTSNKELPFVVQIGGAGIDVLGTIFQIELSDNVVEVENIEGLIKLFEWDNAANSIMLEKGDKATFKDGGIERILPPVETPMIGKFYKVEKIIDYLFLKNEITFNTAPYANINMEDKIFVNLDQPLKDIINQLDTTANLEFRKPCRNCYEVRELTSK